MSRRKWRTRADTVVERAKTVTLEPDHVCDRWASWWEYDAQGIELCRVCPECEDEKLARYRPEILTGYTQADVDEPIEEIG